MDHARKEQLPGVLRLAAGAQLFGRPRRAGLRVPDPQFPSTPATFRHSSYSVPLPAASHRLAFPQPEFPQPGRPGARSSVEQLRWARCPGEGRLHLLEPTDVIAATTHGHAPAVCGHRIAAEGLTITIGPSWALCMACVVGAGCRDGQSRTAAGQLR